MVSKAKPDSSPGGTQRGEQLGDAFEVKGAAQVVSKGAQTELRADHRQAAAEKLVMAPQPLYRWPLAPLVRPRSKSCLASTATCYHKLNHRIACFGKSRLNRAMSAERSAGTT
jgi:hypothetical protein